MTQGFITLAVGSRMYYQLAANLLDSYRKNGNCSAPFAILCDGENEYTRAIRREVRKACR